MLDVRRLDVLNLPVSKMSLFGPVFMNMMMDSREVIQHKRNGQKIKDNNVKCSSAYCEMDFVP